MHLMPINQPKFVFIVTVIINYYYCNIIIFVIIAVIIPVSNIIFCRLCFCHFTKSTVLIPHPTPPHPHELCRAVESEDATETEALLSAAEQGQAGTGKFFYFTTFVQAALIVHELHLLDLASLRQVNLCVTTSIFIYLHVCLYILACTCVYLVVSRVQPVCLCTSLYPCVLGVVEEEEEEEDYKLTWSCITVYLCVFLCVQSCYFMHLPKKLCPFALQT